MIKGGTCFPTADGLYGVSALLVAAYVARAAAAFVIGLSATVRLGKGHGLGLFPSSCALGAGFGEPRVPPRFEDDAPEDLRLVYSIGGKSSGNGFSRDWEMAACGVDD